MHRWRVRLFLTVLACALTALVVGATIWRSESAGRLRTFPVIDNVNYMASGLRLLLDYRERGFGAACGELWRQPPHSPYAVTVAAMAFGVAGVRESAVHASQGLALLVLLVWLAGYLRGPIALRVGSLIAIAALPLWQWSIEVFKPDYMSAVLTVCGVGILLRRPWGVLTRRTWLCAGLLCGAAILAKPVAFPGVLFAYACAAAGRSLARAILRRPRPIAWIPRAALAAGAGCLLVAGPYFSVAWGRVLGYIDVNMFGTRSDQWTFEGSVAQHAVFYLWGPGGDRMLGGMFWFASAGLLIGAGVSLALARRVRTAGRLWLADTAAWSAAIAGPFLLAACNPMKIREFGLTFQLLWCVGGVVAVARAASWASVVRARSDPARRRTQLYAGWLACGAWILAVATTWHWAIGMDDPAQLALMDARTRLAQRVYSDVRSLERAVSPRPVRLAVVGSPGQLGSPLFQIWSARDHAAIAVEGVYGLGGGGQETIGGVETVVARGHRAGPRVGHAHVSRSGLPRHRCAVRQLSGAFAGLAPCVGLSKPPYGPAIFPV